MILYINSKDREAQEQKMQRFKNDIERYYHEQRIDAYNQYKEKIKNRSEPSSPDVFQQCNFKSHAGLDLTWKIECDNISDSEWDCFARMISEVESRQFSEVIGIPRGGIKLQNALSNYTSGHCADPILIVDDVWTTGTSFKEFSEIGLIETLTQDKGWFGWCIFARTPTRNPVRALFDMAVPDSYYDI